MIISYVINIATYHYRSYEIYNMIDKSKKDTGDYYKNIDFDVVSLPYVGIAQTRGTHSATCCAVAHCIRPKPNDATSPERFS